MTMEPLRGMTALVTGASGGLGADFARELARRGCRLVLVARRRDRLDRLAGELRREHGVCAEPIALDLAAPAAPEALFRRLRQLRLEVDVLVNNAGVGLFGEFARMPWKRERAMLALDVRALVHLTKLFVRDMLARGKGYVVQVASAGACQPSPGCASYAAAKGFVRLFGEALHHELRGTGVSCTVVSPGATDTEFFAAAGRRPGFYQRLVMTESGEVARGSIGAMLLGKKSYVPGLATKIAAFFLRILPRRWAGRLRVPAADRKLAHVRPRG